ncbi:hypothetical protein LCGC14_2973890, partial [marine sediment metagenome]
MFSDRASDIEAVMHLNRRLF